MDWFRPSGESLRKATLNLALVVVVTVLHSASALGADGVPPETNSRAWLEGSGTVLVTPAGTGPTLAEQGIVVWVEVVDESDLPMMNYPAQDIWLDDTGDLSLALCRAGSIADKKTDEFGITSISGAIFGGGYTEVGTQVWVAGTPLRGAALDLRLVSPDMDGTRVVDIIDLMLFGQDFGSPSAAADFNVDGLVDLVDFGILGINFGVSCP